MRNYVALIFKDKSRAYAGLRDLWQLDDLGEITVHGTTVIHRDDMGQIQVDTKETHPALATAVGVGVGALLGLFAGPVGIAVGVAAGAGIGAAAGAIVGGVTDLERADTRSRALTETAFVIDRGQAAVIADVSEESVSAVDTCMHKAGGTVNRRAKSELRNDNMWSYDHYLNPYEYIPSRGSLYW